MTDIAVIDVVTGKIVNVRAICDVKYGKGWGMRLADDNMEDIGTLIVENGVAKILQI